MAGPASRRRPQRSVLGMPPYQPSPMTRFTGEPVLRFNFPTGRHSAKRQEYKIRFRDYVMLEPALEALSSATKAETQPSEQTVTSDALKKEKGKSGWLIPDTAEFDRSPEGQIAKHRQEALDILEGLRPHDRCDEYGNAVYKMWFDHRATIDGHVRAALARSPAGKRFICSEQPDIGACSFSWEALHAMIAGGLSDEERAWFPACDRAMVVTLLLAGNENEGGVQKVRNKYNLGDHTAFEFSKLVYDVAARGWRDVIWLSYEGDPMPMGFRCENAVEMAWGEAMI